MIFLEGMAEENLIKFWE